MTATLSQIRSLLVLYGVCAVVAVVALIIGVTNGITNGRQDAEAAAAAKARDEEQATFLSCLDKFAGDTSDRSRLLGVAALKTRDATEAFVSAFEELFRYSLTREGGPDDETVRLFTASANAATGYRKALAEQSRLTAANPPAPAPSKFCEVTP